MYINHRYSRNLPLLQLPTNLKLADTTAVGLHLFNVSSEIDFLITKREQCQKTYTLAIFLKFYCLLDDTCPWQITK